MSNKPTSKPTLYARLKKRGFKTWYGKPISHYKKRKPKKDSSGRGRGQPGRGCGGTKRKRRGKNK